MRVSTTQQDNGVVGGGVIAGVYPNPMFMKYVTAQGFDNFDDDSLTEGVMIPSNYVVPATQTAINNVYSQVEALYPESIGPVDTDEIIRVKAPAFADYIKGNLMKIVPYASLNTDLGGFTPSDGNNGQCQYFKVTTNKVGIMWTVASGSNHEIYFKIGDRSSGRMVWGAEQVLTGILSDQAGPIYNRIENLDSNKMILAYNDANNSNRMSAVAFTVDVSGVLDLVGTPFQIATDAVQPIRNFEYVATDKVIIQWDQLDTTCILSAAALVITKGTTLDIKGSRNVDCKALIRYISDNKLLLIVPDDTSATGNVSGRVMSVSGTTITLETENTANTGGAANVVGIGLFMVSATRAYHWVQFSGSYFVSRITISGTTATVSASHDIEGGTINSNDRIMASVSDGKLYRIDLTDKVIYRFNTEGVLEKQFVTTNTIGSWGSPPDVNTKNYKFKDMRDGFVVYIHELESANLDVCKARVFSPGNRIDIAINGLAAYTNPGSDSFGVIAAIDQDVQSEDQIEIEMTNKSSGFRAFEIETLIVTVV